MKNLGFLILICIFSSCHSQSGQEFMSESKQFDQSELDEDSNESSMESDRKIIKTAEIKFQVNDINVSSVNIQKLTESFSGSISSMAQVNNTYEISNHITVRIPSEKLDEFLSALEKESMFTNYKQISSQDVTEEFLDISTRLNTKKEVRDRYIDILRNKAKTVEDILNAEDKIRVIQEEIESIEGRIKYINDKALMSTVNINIYQEVEYVNTPTTYKKPFMTKIKEGFSNGWDLVLSILIGLITIWPILLLFIVFFLLRRKIFKFLKR